MNTFLKVVNKVAKYIIYLKRTCCRIAVIPRRLCTGTLISQGLPIRLDVINTKSIDDRRKTRCVFSSKNPLKLLRPVRRIQEVKEIVYEQPLCKDLIYVLTHEGGEQSLSRDPFKETVYKKTKCIIRQHDRKRSRDVSISGVKANHVISAFAGDYNVTRFAVCVESCANFQDMTFEDWYEYLRYKGFKQNYKEIAILLTDMSVSILRAKM